MPLERLEKENKRLRDTCMRSELENEMLALELVNDRVRLKGNLDQVRLDVLSDRLEGKTFVFVLSGRRSNRNVDTRITGDEIDRQRGRTTHDEIERRTGKRLTRDSSRSNENISLLFRFATLFVARAKNFNRRKRSSPNTNKFEFGFRRSFSHFDVQICSQLNGRLDRRKEKYKSKIELIQVKFCSKARRSSSFDLESLLFEMSIGDRSEFIAEFERRFDSGTRDHR